MSIVWELTAEEAEDLLLLFKESPTSHESPIRPLTEAKLKAAIERHQRAERIKSFFKDKSCHEECQG